MKFMRVVLLLSITVVFLVILAKEHISKTIPFEGGRVNILVMGIGGENHTGSDLTDTMMMLSFHETNNDSAIVTFPRDIWSNALQDKINSAYHYGGLALSKKTVSEIVGFPVQFGIVFDFSGFEQIINSVGGIEINVPAEFTDPEYPVAGRQNDPCFTCRYETVHFDAGNQTMDGARALAYIRSRHATGDEGTDFARSRRQQEVILALKEKLISTDVLLHPNVYKKLMSLFEKATDTDMQTGELLAMGALFAGIPKEKITRISIEDLLYAPPNTLYGRYVLVPKTSWEDISMYIKNMLESKPQ